MGQKDARSAWQETAHRLRLFVDKHGGIARVAALMGLPYSTLAHYTEGESQLPIHLLAPLYAATRDHEGLAELAGLGIAGLIFTPRPEALDAPTGQRIERTMVSVLARAGALAEVAEKANSDGDVDALERRQLRRAAVHLQTVAQRIVDECDAMDAGVVPLRPGRTR